ncbi:MAG: hypothetical protein QM398_04725 [Thermoproteota archaeon]|nr:hypothetical protein [Thermoproteota archaeon]
MTFTLNETATWIGYSLDGNEHITIQTNNYNITLVDLAEGIHNVTVYAQNQEANIGASENITFNIEFPKLERFHISVLVVALILLAVVIALVMFFRKHRKNAYLSK